MSVCLNCVRDVTHEEAPEGEWENLGSRGYPSYVATPPDGMDYPKDKVLLFLSDISGPQNINAQRLADDFARNGFKTVILPQPEFIPADDLGPGNTFDLDKWLKYNDPKTMRPVLNRVIDALKAEGVTIFAATGYSIGSKYAFNLAFDGVLTAAVVSHPFLLKIPEDLEKWAKTTVPLLINSCETDPQFPAESQAKADEILGGGKFKPGYEREHWGGCTRGFALRGDMSNPRVKAGKEGAFKAAVEWLAKHGLRE